MMVEKVVSKFDRIDAFRIKEDTMNKRKTAVGHGRKKIYIFLTVSLLIGLAAFFVFKEETQKFDTQTIPPLVRTYMLETGHGRHFQLTGAVHARVESNLGFRVPGKIVKRLVDKGQRVTKGQHLMELDAVDLELAQKAARATVVSARAENVRALQDEERQRVLLQKHAVSQQEYESAKAQADSTTANLHAAEASARQADNQVQYAVLRADADGIIMDVMADVGQVVAAGQTVASLAQNDTREAVVYLPETMTSYAKDAKEAFLYSDPAKRFNVSLRELSATADPVTRTYQGRYTLEGDGQSAPLGSTVTVSFATPHDGNANTYRVPIGALYDNGNGSCIWIVDAVTSTVHPKPVTVIDLGEEFASVTGDLSSGDQVVALGVHLLKDNEKVRIDNVNIADGR